MESGRGALQSDRGVVTFFNYTEHGSFLQGKDILKTFWEELVLCALYCADKVATGTLSQLTMDNGNEELETRRQHKHRGRPCLVSIFRIFFLDFLIQKNCNIIAYRIPVS